MFTITNEVAKLIQSGASKEKAARAAKRQAIDLIVAQGGRGHHFTKDAVKNGLVAKETLQGVQGLIAKGLFSASEFSLWAMDSKEASKQGKQDERNKLTSDVSAYLASFRKMVETQWALLNPDAAAAEKAELESESEKSGDDLENEKSGLESEPEKMELNAANLLKHINELTLAISASKDSSIVAIRAKLIPALNAVQSACK
jgi:hypothetical protein